MFSPDDTIVAMATPEGRGALGIVRLSGPNAHAVALGLLGRSRPMPPRVAVVGIVRDTRGPAESARARPTDPSAPLLLDQVVATYFQGPKSYTGEDTVELSAHGGPAILSGILRAAMAHGARLARPGEFTLRAYLHGRIDLVQAEAVGDLIEAVTPLQASVAFDQLRGSLSQDIASIERTLFDVVARLEASLDFPDEGYHFVETALLPSELRGVVARVDRLLASARTGRVIREGRTVALVGRPNVGKSSLFNALVGGDRAIVTPIAGTTRDLLTERVEVEGIPVTLVDSAGIHDAGEAIEREGIARARQLASSADVRLLVVDRSSPLESIDIELLTPLRPGGSLVVANKIDAAPAWESLSTDVRQVGVSARTGAGLNELKRELRDVLIGREWLAEGGAVSNVRHVGLLEQAATALGKALEAVLEGAPEEFVLLDIREALDAMGEVTGRRTADDVLANIFSRFCIGK